MEAHGEDVRKYATCPLSQASGASLEQEIRLVVIPVDHKVIRTKRGDKMAFVTIQDQDVTVEAVFFSEPWARSQKAITGETAVLVTGRLEVDLDGTVKVLAKSAESLDDVRARTTREVRISLRPEEADARRLAKLKELLNESPGGCRTRIYMSVPEQFDATLSLPDHPVSPTQQLTDELCRLFERSDVVSLQ
jgi:DNA polymerase-3 subunit alpha